MVVAIDPDADDFENVAGVQEFVAQTGVTFPVGVEVTSTYEMFTENHDGANPYPVDVIVDRSGIIRYVAREYDPAAMRAVVEELLAE